MSEFIELTKIDADGEETPTIFNKKLIERVYCSGEDVYVVMHHSSAYRVKEDYDYIAEQL